MGSEMCIRDRAYSVKKEASISNNLDRKVIIEQGVFPLLCFSSVSLSNFQETHNNILCKYEFAIMCPTLLSECSLKVVVKFTN